MNNVVCFRREWKFRDGLKVPALTAELHNNRDWDYWIDYDDGEDVFVLRVWAKLPDQKNARH